MPITIEWKDDSRDILVSRYFGRWTWDDFYESDATVRHMLDQVQHRVHLIIDVSRNIWFPPDMAEHADRIAASIDPRLGIIILVGQEINRELLDLLAQQNDTINNRYGFAHDVDSAQHMIDHRRQAN